MIDDLQLIAAKLKGVHCKDPRNAGEEDYYKMVYSDVICGGLEWQKKSGWVCGYGSLLNQPGVMLSRCSMAQADSAFMLLTVIVVCVAAVLGYLRMRRGY